MDYENDSIPGVNINLDDNKEYDHEGNESYNKGNDNNGPMFGDVQPGESTLDEDISKTIMRDLKMIYEKVKIALLPFRANKADQEKLKEWDFWGPLIFSFLLGLILSLGRRSEQSGTVFILVFVIVWFGGLIVSLNSQFLGVQLSKYQCISILGYCLFAIVLVSLLNLITQFLPIIFRVLFSFCGFGYSSYGKSII